MSRMTKYRYESNYYAVSGYICGSFNVGYESREPQQFRKNRKTISFVRYSNQSDY